jgi:hypothetical protein
LLERRRVPFEQLVVVEVDDDQVTVFGDAFRRAIGAHVAGLSQRKVCAGRTSPSTVRYNHPRSHRRTTDSRDVTIDAFGVDR